MSETILVTGGTGFLGEQVVHSLRSSGRYRPKVLARSATAIFDADDDVEWTPGDVLCEQDLERALKGCVGVIHLAGLVSRDPSDGSHMMRIHIEGTRALLRAMKKQNIGRIVVASTSGTVAVSKSAEVLDERAGYATSLVAGWPYYASKMYQEKLALDWGDKSGAEVVVVNPSLLLGPGDRRLSSTGDIHRFLRGQVPFVPRGGLNFVDVRDAAAATVAAFSCGRPGERYLLGGPNWTFQEFFGRVARIADVSQPRVRLPSNVTRWGAFCVQEVFRAFGKPPPVDVVSAEMGEHYWYVDSSKARRELGFTPRDPGLTLGDTVRYLRQGIGNP